MKSFMVCVEEEVGGGGGSKEGVGKIGPSKTAFS